MIKYLGSKRLLVPSILDLVRVHAPDANTVLDLFSGTSRVGHALKRAGYRVMANDHNAYAHRLATCYVQADRENVEREALMLIRELSSLPGTPGYFTETFCDRSRFVHPVNGERIDAIREMIARKCLSPELESVLLVSLMEAADRVDSTTGLQMAYLKGWAPRAHKPLELRMPDVLPRARAGKGEAHRLEALDAARSLKADVAYVDPPYNQHSYLGNYHVWESLVMWDKPEVYGVACKRTDCKDRRSAFNMRTTCHAAVQDVLTSLQSRVLIVSFSDEGHISRGEMESMLSAVAGAGRSVTTIAIPFNRYVGARIGIYNPRGEKVGRIGHLRNTEYLFLVTPLRDLSECQARGPAREGSAVASSTLEVEASAVAATAKSPV